MERRELLKMIAAATGAAFIGNPLALAAESTQRLGTGFSTEDVLLLNEIAETIIPRTDSPGAKDANIGQLMTRLVSDCYLPGEQALFRQGMQELNETALSQFSKPFLLLEQKHKHSLLSGLNDEAYRYNKQNKVRHWELGRPGGMPGEDKALPHYFTLFKQLTLFGFFTSKPGATQVLRYVAVPGRYDGEFPYKKGDKAWAT